MISMREAETLPAFFVYVEGGEILAQKVSIDRESIIADLEKRITELSYPELTNLTEIEKNKQLKNIEHTLNEYLIKYNQINSLVTQSLIERKNQLDNFDDSDPRKLYGLYKSLLYDKEVGVEINNLLRDGYILIENLRKTFTGQEIIYEIGMVYGRGKNRFWPFNEINF